MPPTLQQIVTPAVESLRGAYLRYLRTSDPEEIAIDITRNPFRSAGIAEHVLAQHRLVTLRSNKIGAYLETCSMLIASRHEGSILTLVEGAIAFTLERPNDWVVAIIQSRLRGENGSSQAKGSRQQLDDTCESIRAHSDKPIHAVRVFAAEPGLDREYELKKGVHQINGPLWFHVLTGDRGCWNQLLAMCETALGDREVRRAELDYRAAVERALLEVADHAITESEYERSRYELEQILGPCCPVLMETPRAALPPDIFDVLAELDDQ